MKILVVEDNPGDVELLKRAFQEVHAHAEIQVARDGEECLALLLGEQVQQANYPDLIFLELTLPRMSGYEVLEQIKTNAKTRHIPVIVLSSTRLEADVARAYGAHANAYVQKAATLEGLLTAARGLKTFWMETARLANSFSPN